MRLSLFVKGDAMSKIYIFIAMLLNGFTLLGSESRVASTESFVQLLGKGGPVMLPLYGLSFVGLCLIFYYLFTLRIELLAPKEFINKAEDALIDQDYEILEDICSNNSCMLSGILENGVSLAKKTKDYSLIKDSIEDEGARQGSLLWQRIHYLYDIAVIAPML